ncbi:MAG: hypothetical protein LBD37_05280 [Treponema sp.]|jgi:hypothetical protein|nr:hypothetical protein [Treponema sp.]
MKRMVLGILLLVSAAAAGLAKDRQYGGRRHPCFPDHPLSRPVFPAFPAEIITISGTMTIVQGFLAVQSNDTAYLTPGLDRYVGFIEALKDGAPVSLEGSALNYSQDGTIKTLRVTKLTVGGKSYDLARPQAAYPAPPRIRPRGR